MSGSTEVQAAQEPKPLLAVQIFASIEELAAGLFRLGSWRDADGENHLDREGSRFSDPPTMAVRDRDQCP
ncbi:hypothetical protein GE061_018051 [Apolygus lucorum]|uniref:Uncharacterized protein n=1 Tax=Apolygus lucorum TaxID=248454 RepID=A0A8S9XGR8_APOLU|nr:hypothetical protein GE061_018051 [Apolygus lucorum]